MKIVFLILGFYEGLEYQENILLKYYEKLGHEVHVITSTERSIFDYAANRIARGGEEQTYKLGTATIYRRRFKIHLPYRIERFADVTPLLEEIRPDLIFVHNIVLNTDECVRYVRRHPECKMILDYHGDFSNSGANWLSRRILHGVLFRHVLAQARPHLSRIFPVTPGSAKFLNVLYGVPYEEMEVLPLGSDLEAVRRVRAAGARSQLREKYGIAAETFVIFTGGKLAPTKRTEYLIQAVRELPPEAVQLIVAGDAAPENQPYKEQLLKQAEGCRNIRFVGWLKPDEVYAHLDLADAAVFPAGQSILWQQSLSMGLPLVVGDATNGEQDVSYLNKYDNILVLDGQRPLAETLREGLAMLLSDPALRAKMSAGAQKVTAELLDWEVLIQRTLRFNT